MRRSSNRRGAPFTSGLARFVKYQGRSLCASALAVSMVVGLTGPGFQAGSTDSSSLYEYEFDSEELYWALQDAIQSGSEADTSKMEFSGTEAEAYEALFAADGESDYIFKLNPDLEGQDDDLKLTVYARLNTEEAQLLNDLGDEADARYQVTGDESFIFLLENTTDTEQSARIVIDGVPTETITAKPGVTLKAEEETAAAGPAEETVTADENAETSGESAEESTEAAETPGTAADESKAAAETATAEETGASADALTAETAAEAENGADRAEMIHNEETAESEAAAAETGEMTEAGEETETAEEAEAAAGTEDAAGEEPDAEAAGAGMAEDAAAAEPEVTVGAAAISLKKVARVAAHVTRATASDAEKASTSDATATDSNADVPTLDGEIYESVLMGKKAVTACTVGADTLNLKQFNGLDNVLTFYNKDLEDVYVRVNTPLESFGGKKVKLVVTELDEEKAAENEAALEAEGITYDWIRSVDVHFETMDGTEIEPDPAAGEVQVYTRVKDLPEEVDPASLAVIHMPENEDGSIKEPEQVAAAQTAAEDAAETAILSEDNTADTADAGTAADEIENGTVLLTGDQAEANFRLEKFSTINTTATLLSADNGTSATVTIEQGKSGTINDAEDHDEWRVVDNNGDVVENVSVSQNYWGNLTISVGSSVIPGTYKIQQRGWELVHKGLLNWKHEYHDWTDSGYVVEVTRAQGYQPHTNGQTITKGNGGGTPGTTTEPTPSIAKTATKYSGNDNYTYDLGLTVSSTVGSTESKTAIDLLFIIDRSGSMTETKPTRLSQTKTAVNNLIDTLTNETNSQKLDMNFAVVTFSGPTKTDPYDSDRTEYDDAETACGWTGDKETVKDSVNGIDSSGGTNYEAGLVAGHDVLTGARAAAYKYVIFLSDGKPTFHYALNGKTAGRGNQTSEDDVSHAEAAAKTLVGINGFYTVYVNNNTDGKQYLEKLATALESVDSTVSTGNYSSDGTDLDKIFDNFGKQITEMACTKVTISDTLSNWVVPVKNATPYVIIKVENKNGNVTTYSSKTGAEHSLSELTGGEADITASYVSTTKQLKLNFPEDYSLKSGYTYEVHMDIEPTAEAKAKGESGYDLIADANTGTHAGKSGYKSNADNSAKLTYTVDGEDRSIDYPKPVVQVPEGWTLTIKKTLSGNMYNENDTFNFKVTSDKASIGNATSGSSEGVTAEFSEDGKSATVTLGKDKKVALKVPDGAKITITETNAEGYTASYTVATGGTNGALSDGVYTINKISADTDVTVNNDKTVTVDTGAFLDRAPYLLLATAIAGGAALTISRRKREDN